MQHLSDNKRLYHSEKYTCVQFGNFGKINSLKIKSQFIEALMNMSSSNEV